MSIGSPPILLASPVSDGFCTVMPGVRWGLRRSLRRGPTAPKGTLGTCSAEVGGSKPSFDVVLHSFCFIIDRAGSGQAVSLLHRSARIHT